jgi:menaquinol-cytochrome c reductase cytochrome b/c subunit
MSLIDDPIEKQVYDVEYKKMKEKGKPFHPFTTWKDIVVALGVLVLLITLTATLGVHLDAPADPTSEYLPRPEWYFMFLFQLLKMFPPWAIILPAAIIPGLAGAALLLLPFYDINPYRQWHKRKLAVTVMGLGVFAVVFLTGQAYWDDAHDPHAQALLKGGGEKPEAAAVTKTEGADGEKIFTANCAMCHGASGAQIPNVALLSKSFIADRDVVAVLNNGKGGMPSFKGRLSDDEMQSVSKWLKDNAK